MIDKSALTKFVWYDWEKWKVEKIISPNIYDDFLLVSRKVKKEIHLDGKTVPVEMILLDAHNMEFYPDTPYVRVVSKRMRNLQNQLLQRDDKLRQMWLDMLRA